MCNSFTATTFGFASFCEKSHRGSVLVSCLLHPLHSQAMASFSSLEIASLQSAVEFDSLCLPGTVGSIDSGNNIEIPSMLGNCLHRHVSVCHVHAFSAVFFHLQHPDGSHFPKLMIHPYAGKKGQV